MPIYNYRQLPINISEQDSEYAGYFLAAQEHRLVVKKCLDCELLRGEPGASCPWCASMESEWHEVSGKGDDLLLPDNPPRHPARLPRLDAVPGSVGRTRRTARRTGRWRRPTHHRQPRNRRHGRRRRRERRHRQARPRRIHGYGGRPNPSTIHPHRRTPRRRSLAIPRIDKAATKSLPP